MGYCKKHDLEYMDHLDKCPICEGEKLWDPPTPPKKKKENKGS